MTKVVLHNSATINGVQTFEWKNAIGPYSTLPVFMELNVEGKTIDNREDKKEDNI